MFCQVADLADFLQIEISPADLSAIQAITDATAVIKAYTNQTLDKVTDDTETFDNVFGNKLYLRQFPVISVTSVIENGITLVDGIDFKLGNHGVLYRLNALWSYGIQNIVVTYTHGYAVVPDIARIVCMRVASRVYQAGKRSAETSGVPGISSKTLGDFSVSYEGESGSNDPAKGVSAARTLLISEKELLDTLRYRQL